MKVLFFGDKKFVNYAFTIACADAFSGCEVEYCSDAAFSGVGKATWRPFAKIIQNAVADYPALAHIIPVTGHSLCKWSLVRWFATLEMWKQHDSNEPMFCADWDVLIFRDLNITTKPFMDKYWSVSKHEVDAWSSPYLVLHREVVENFCKYVSACHASGRLPIGTNGISDMAAWTAFARDTCYVPGDLNRIVNDSLFDGNNLLNLHGLLVRESDGKRIVWVDKKPYFVMADTERLIAANTIHCCTWKDRIPEFVKQAGL